MGVVVEVKPVLAEAQKPVDELVEVGVEVEVIL